MSSTGGSAGSTAPSSSQSGASAQAGKVADQAQERVGQVKDQATEEANQGLDKASSGLGTAADKLKELSGQGGSLPAQAGMVADRLEQASNYLKGKHANQIITDLAAFVREKPVESVMGAVAIGFILARIVR